MKHLLLTTIAAVLMVGCATPTQSPNPPLFDAVKKGDIEAVVQTIMKLGKFAEKNASRLIEADINPLIVRPKGKGVIAADALIHYLEDIK